MAINSTEAQPITEDDPPLVCPPMVARARYLQDAHIPSLMAALVHITGDLSLVRGDIRPAGELFGDAQGGITEEQQEHIRGLALDALRSFRDIQAPAQALSEDALQRQ